MLTLRTTAIVDTAFHLRYVRLIHEAGRGIAPFCLSDVIQGRVILGMGGSYHTCRVETLSGEPLYVGARRAPPGLVGRVRVNLIEETDPDEDDH